MTMGASSPMEPIYLSRWIKLYWAPVGSFTYPGIHLWLGRYGRWLRWLPNVHDNHMRVRRGR